MNEQAKFRFAQPRHPLIVLLLRLYYQLSFTSIVSNNVDGYEARNNSKSRLKVKLIASAGWRRIGR